MLGGGGGEAAAKTTTKGVNGIRDGFKDAAFMVKFLDGKFSNNNKRNYVIKEISEESLEDESLNTKQLMVLYGDLLYFSSLLEPQCYYVST